MSEDRLTSLKDIPVPRASEEARARAREAAMMAFDAAQEKNVSAHQGPSIVSRLISRIWIKPTEWMMERQSRIAATALALLLAPGAAYIGLNVAAPGMWERPSRSSGTGSNQGILGTLNMSGPSKPAKVPAGPKAKISPRSETLPTDPRAADRELARLPLSEAITRQQAEKRRDVRRPAQRAAGGLSRNKQAGSPSGDIAVRVVPTVIQQQKVAPPQYRDGVIQSRPQGRDQFAAKEANPVKSVLREPVSTFSIDVDTASYAFVRRSLKAGRVPPKGSIRVEEMINYFTYGYSGPDNADTPFRTNVSVSPTLWNSDTKLMHIGIKGFDIQSNTKPRANLVFLIDVSGSMRSQDKIGLLKSSFRLLVEKLDPEDTVSIVTYAGRAGTALKPTKAKDKQTILQAIDSLTSGGSTAGAAGIQQAYALAQKNYDKDGVNRVILATDGDFNVGISDREQLKAFIEEKRKSGVFLSVLGFGQGNYNDALMQTLAQNGNGTAAYIDTLKEAQKVLVEEAGSTLFPIAKDVKIQVEFNPRTVSEYRLIGYETRALRREDFKNDKVDAGDIGSGHTVTAIYEIVPVGSPAISTDPLRYADNKDGEERIASIGSKDEYAFVKLRYKLPKEDRSKLVTMPVKTGDTATVSDDVRFAKAVAAFGQKLRGESQLDALSYDAIIKEALATRGADPYGYRAEFISLVRLAKSLPKGPQVTTPSGPAPGMPQSQPR